MEVQIAGRHPGLTPHLRQYVEDKVQRLGRYFDGTHRVDVVLSRDGLENVVELLVWATGKKIVSASRGPDLYAAFDAVLDKAEKQLVRHKEKLRDRRTKPGSSPQSTQEAAEEEGSESE